MSISFPLPHESMLIVIDAQERLCPAMAELEARLGAIVKAVKVARLLGVDTLVTEQYPKGLGPTHRLVREQLPATAKVVSKTCFSAWHAPAFGTAVEAVRPRALVLTGMESHVCVQLTALDCVRRGYETYLLADAVGSRRALDRECAVELMRAAGVRVTTFETVAFAWLRDSMHPKFREAVAIVR